ncbi:Binding-protein-dependent transport system inner membrane component [Desulfuromusa kysingii]|uniref:Binding-protein-dependent transport system inner membrane component n=1 Tax=Desulfuromusa kysingii TaxID=37625 RepID=A0A1H4DK63_9BACT|nr:putative 2-aminoethylphosphonate ABC transporter permease subunit [Desulfuromusa kysingii]SEA72879.1 Binding-protein-dependent transport system inner membrane component [Desulfuromusa kysingii]
MSHSDNIEGFSLSPPADEVRLKSSGEDLLRRALIILSCLWLLIGVVLPLGEVWNRATHVEFVVKIEEPTEAEKVTDSFRGQINIAGHSVLLIEENIGPLVYFDNKLLVLVGNQAKFGPIQITLGDQRLDKVVYSPTRADYASYLISPLVVEYSPERHWLIDGKPFDSGVASVQRFIGLQNFFAYFGIEGLSQTKTIGLLVYLITTLALSAFLLYSLLRRSLPANRNYLLTFSVLLLLGTQSVLAINYLGQHITDTNLAQSVLNSLRVALYSTSISVALAFAYAYGINRTCMRGKTFFRLIAMLPLFAPTMLYGLSLVYLFGNKGVITTGFFEKFPWLAWDIGLYGFTGVVMAEVVFTFPPAFMILMVAISTSDARLYEAAESMGASKLKTFFTVTLPSIKFGLLSAVFVSFTLSFTDFGAPKVVGGQFNVLAVDIYKQVIGQQNFGMGATVSIVLLAPTILAFVADRIVQRRAVAVVTARSVPYTPKSLALRDGCFFLLNSLIALFILTMVFMAGIASLVKMWPYSFTNPELYPQAWTLSHYAFEAVGGGGYGAFFNSIRMALWTALFGSIITFTSAYLIEKTKGMRLLRQLGYFLSIIPLALPGLVIGIAYIFFFNASEINIPLIGLSVPNPFNVLYGTMALLVLSNIIHFYTVSFLTATTALRQLDKEFEAVSESMSVPFYTTFVRVTVPVCFPALLEIASYLFVSSMATVSAVIFLYSSDLSLASVAVVNMDDAGDTAPAAAMCMLIVLTNVIVRMLFERISWLFRRRTQIWRH